MILVKKLEFFILLFLFAVETPALGEDSSFRSCQLKVELDEVSQNLDSEKGEKGFTVEMNFRPKKVVTGNCSKLVGEKLKKNVLIRSKQTLQDLSKGSLLVLDYSHFSSGAKDDSSLDMEKWRMVSERPKRGKEFRSPREKK